MKRVTDTEGVAWLVWLGLRTTTKLRFSKTLNAYHLPVWLVPFYRIAVRMGHYPKVRDTRTLRTPHATWRGLVLVVLKDPELQRALEVSESMGVAASEAFGLEVYNEYVNRITKDAPHVKALVHRQKAREMRLRGAPTGGRGAQRNGDPIPRPTDEAFLREAILTPKKRKKPDDA